MTTDRVFMLAGLGALAWFLMQRNTSQAGTGQVYYPPPSLFPGQGGSSSPVPSSATQGSPVTTAPSGVITRLPLAPTPAMSTAMIVRTPSSSTAPTLTAPTLTVTATDTPLVRNQYL